MPIETPAFAYSKVLANLDTIPYVAARLVSSAHGPRSGIIKPTLRMAKSKAGPVVTDNGNFVIDATFDEAHMREPQELLFKLKMLTGIVEIGLFVESASVCAALTRLMRGQCAPRPTLATLSTAPSSSNTPTAAASISPRGRAMSRRARRNRRCPIRRGKCDACHD